MSVTRQVRNPRYSEVSAVAERLTGNPWIAGSLMPGPACRPSFNKWSHSPKELTAPSVLSGRGTRMERAEAAGMGSRH